MPILLFYAKSITIRDALFYCSETFLLPFIFLQHILYLRCYKREVQVIYNIQEPHADEG